MSYTAKTLLAEEKIIYHTKPHFVIFFRFLIWLTLAYFSHKYLQNEIVTFLMLAVGAVVFLKTAIYYYFSEYVITNKRILVKVGFIRRRSLEIFLNRVEGVYIDQGIIGRIFHFGTVIVAGIGGTKNPFYYIPNPLEFRKKIQEQTQKKEGKI